MASSIGVRFVRCPKCVKVLTEFAHVPIYKCGGCDTVLRVKVHIPIGEQTATESLENCLAESSTWTNKSAFSEEMVAKSDHHRCASSNSNAARDSKGKEVREHGGNPENLSEKGNQARKEVAVDEEEATEKKEEEPSYYVAFLEGDIDGSVSSGEDEQQEAPSPPPMSKRSFRHEKALSTDTSTTNTEKGPQIAPTELYERDATLGWADGFHSVQNWMGSEIDDDALITLSKDLQFRGDSKFSYYSDPDQTKILRKVDELRDELSEFLINPKAPIRNDYESGRHGGRRVKKQPAAAKQYCRPVRGGAPFVICYKCWKLLQLPADFLVPGKAAALHKLRCGACSEILVFSFRPRVVPTPAEDGAQHPPSEVEHHSRSERPEPPEPVHNVSTSSSYSAFGSRLHRLMGYSSASDVLFRSGHADGGGGGYESSETSTPPPESRPEEMRWKNPEERAIAPRRRGSALCEFSKGLFGSAKWSW